MALRNRVVHARIDDTTFGQNNLNYGSGVINFLTAVIFLKIVINSLMRLLMD